MFGRTRKRFEELERTIEKLADRFDAAIEKLAERHPPTTPDATAVLAQAFGAVAGNQAEMVKSLGDLAMRGAARRMGIRGGSKRAQTGQRDERGKFIPMKRVNPPASRQPTCPLCIDPTYRDVTIPMIQAHRDHERLRYAALQPAEAQFEPHRSANHDSSDNPNADDPEPAGSGLGGNGQPPGNSRVH